MTGDVTSVRAADRARIIVVGAGFGGMAAVKALKGADADITLVDRTSHHLFQPLLYQVATAALSPADIATATRALLRRQKNVTILMDEVSGVVPGSRIVQLASGHELSYDFLILELRLGQSVTAIDAAGLMIGDDRIETRNVLWCAGTAARPAARWLGVEATRNGAVKVRGDCSVPGHPEIFAIGDVVSHDDGSGKPLPGLAPVAKQQGRYVARS